MPRQMGFRRSRRTGRPTSTAVPTAQAGAVRPLILVVLSLVALGCAGAPERPQPRAAYDQEQTRQDLDRMIQEHGDPDGRLARLRDQLPEVPPASQRTRQDVLMLKPGSGPRPVSAPSPVEQSRR